MHPLIYLAALAAGALAQGIATTQPTPTGAGLYDLLLAALQAGGMPLVLLVILVVLVVRGVRIPAIPIHLEGPLVIQVSGPVEIRGLCQAPDEEQRSGAHG